LRRAQRRAGHRELRVLVLELSGTMLSGVEAWIRLAQIDDREHTLSPARSCRLIGVSSPDHPQWMGQNLVITGTVSRVDIDTKGFLSG
jgi:hypothetical protein